MKSEAEPRAWGIVLAGVNRWDESAIDRALPRPLLPILDAPLIEYVLRWLNDGGVPAATLCAGSVAQPLQRCLWDGQRLGLDLHYYEDWTPRGPAGCARDAALATPADVFVIADGTIIPRIDLTDLLSAHCRAHADFTVVVQPDQAQEAHVATRYSPVGVYVASRAVLEQVLAAGYQDIKEMLIPSLHRGGARVLSYQAAGVCPRVRDVGSYLAVHEWLLDELHDDENALCNGLRRVDQAWIHPTAQVADDARLVGPVVVGADVIVASRATVLGPTVLGRGCVIEPHAVVARAVLWSGVRVANGALVDRCVIADGAMVPARQHAYGRLYVAAPRRAKPGRRPAHLQDCSRVLPSGGWHGQRGK